MRVQKKNSKIKRKKERPFSCSSTCVSEGLRRRKKPLLECWVFRVVGRRQLRCVEKNSLIVKHAYLLKIDLTLTLRAGKSSIWLMCLQHSMSVKLLELFFPPASWYRASDKIVWMISSCTFFHCLGVSLLLLSSLYTEWVFLSFLPQHCRGDLI